MLVDRLERYDVPVWLVNTGWTGGPYGIGERMNIDQTRDMVRAALDGGLEGVPTVTDPVFGVEVPTACRACLPRSSCRGHMGGCGRLRRRRATLADMFDENFEAYADGVSPAVRNAGPIDFKDAGDVKMSAPGEG